MKSFNIEVYLIRHGGYKGAVPWEASGVAGKLKAQKPCKPAELDRIPLRSPDILHMFSKV